MAEPRRRWARMSLRLRLLVLTLAGVALVQALGSVALYVALSYSGNRTIDASARATATQVAGLVASGRLPATLSVTGSEIVQVLDDRGRVLSASTNADRLTAMLVPAEVARAEEEPVTVPGSRLGVSSRLRIRVSSVASSSRERVQVVVAEPVDELTRGATALPRLLLVSYPLLLAVLGLIAWRLIGAALRPVETLRTSAERISGSPGRDERLPLPAADDEVQALARTLNSLLDRVVAARDRERDLVADVAHELRSPLASMRMQVDVAALAGIGPEELSDLDVEVTRMSRLVEDLLVLARLEAATPGATTGTAPDTGPDTGPDAAPDTAPVTTAVGPVLEAVVRTYAGSVALSPVGVLMVALGPDELTRIVDNLVANAVRHARSSVLVEAHAEPGRVVVSVDDDGPGIAPLERERVFERFVRLDEARDRDSGGSGLGLAIARELARGRGGDVRLTTSPAGGLRAQVDLPSR